MKNIIILTGHGNYATGVKTTINLISGPTTGVEYIDFLEEYSSDMLCSEFEKVVERNKENNIIFVCDIVGGTPFNTAVKLSLMKEKIKVVAGCNITAILEGILLKDTMELDELCEMFVNKTKETVSKYKKVKTVILNEEFEDGI